MNRCPFGFLDLGVKAVAFRCDASPRACPDRPDPAFRAYRRPDLPDRRPVTTYQPGPEDRKWRRPAGGSCQHCEQPVSSPVCPRCHHDLPAGWLEVQTTCIAVAGPRSSGKSVYIGVLVRQAQLLVEQLGGAMSFGDAWTQSVYVRHYQTPLWEERGLVESTVRQSVGDGDAPQRGPMLFSLGTLQGKRQVLVIRDVAGEDLEDAGVVPEPFRFFREADGIVFLVDPLKRAAIRLMLKGIVDTESATVGGEPLQVLDNLSRIIRGDDQSRVQVPLAVVLSKFDALRELQRVPDSSWDGVMNNTGAAINRDASPEPHFDPDDADLLQAEVTSILARLNEQAVINRLEAEFACTRLFAVSALGAPPKGRGLHAQGIAPFRCLDPLKWVMSRTGAVPTV